MTVPSLKPFREIIESPEEREIRFHFHPGQMRAMECKAQFPVLSWGSQAGKTVMGPVWLRREIERCGAGDYLAVTSTFDLFKLKMVPELLDYLEGTLHIARYWAESRIIEIAEDLQPGRFTAKGPDSPMWARLILRSAEAKGGLEAATVKAAWLDECGQPEFTRAAYEAVKRRCAIHQARIFHTTTLYQDGWFVHDVYQKAEKRTEGYELICVDSIENPAYPMASWEAAKLSLPPWKFDMFQRGRFRRAVGQIYDCFNEASQSIPRRELPKDWPVVVGHDFGPINNAALFWRESPVGDYYLFQTYHPAEARSTGDHIAAWKEIIGDMFVKRRIGGNHGEQETRDGYGAQGWPISEPSIRDVKEGILRVYGLKRSGRIYVFNDLEEYLEENRRYSWKLDTGYKPTDDIQDKASFHFMDCERYGLGSMPREILEMSTGNALPMRYAYV